MPIKNENSRIMKLSLVGFIFSFVFFLIFPSSIFAAISGPTNAGAGSVVTGVGTITWSHPENIVISGAPYSTATSIPLGGASHYLVGTNFGFNIPAGATIDGITVTINRNGTQAGISPNLAGIQDNSVYLVKDNGGSPLIQTSGNNKATTTLWSTSLRTVTYGSASDLWGLAWTPSDINNANFGVAISAKITSNALTPKTATVDYIQITVTYTPDTTPPVVTVPSDITQEATSPNGAAVSFSATATDAVDGSLTPICIPESGSTFALETTLVTCNATDSAGNTGTNSFNIIVQDTTGPVIDAHDNVTEEATSFSGTIVTYTSPATHDIVDGDGTAICLPSSGSAFALGDNLITCSAVDAHGNNASEITFYVIVQDTTPPVIDGTSSDIILEATSSAGAEGTYTSPTATDLVDGSLEVSCLPASGSTFALGDTTVTCSATDSHSNTASSTFKITVQDTTAPTIDSHNDITGIEATSSEGAVVTYTSPATHDIVDGDGTATCSPESDSTFPLGNTTVNCGAVDSYGNTAINTTFVVQVVDTTPPTSPSLTHPSANALLNATPEFSWNASSDAVGTITYTLEVSQNSDFSSPIINVFGITSTNFSPESDLQTGKYYWRVIANDGFNDALSKSRTFTLFPSNTPIHDETSSGSIETTVNASSEANVSLVINTTSPVEVFVAPTTDPAANFGMLGLGKFVEITADDQSAIVFPVLIQMHYTDADVAAAGIDESTLNIYFYNTTSASWEVAPSSTVDTVNNVVSALVDHFSTYGTYGSASIPTTSQQQFSSINGFVIAKPKIQTTTTTTQTPTATTVTTSQTTKTPTPTSTQTTLPTVTSANPITGFFALPTAQYSVAAITVIVIIFLLWNFVFKKSEISLPQK